MTRVVKWLFFILFCNAFLYSSLGESGFISSDATAGHDLKPLVKEGQRKNHVFMSERTSGLHEALKIGKEKKLEIEDENKKGKGSYGGGDILRPRSKKSGANPLMLKSSSLISTLLLRCVVLGLLPIIFFF
ncbi:hypothetical protein PTKIN_Ptkin19aG0119000 [Pterospermum kingtungense]